MPNVVLATDPRTVPVRFTHLKKFADSAMHYRSSVTEGRDDTRSFRLGRAAHKIALEGAPWLGAPDLVIWSGKQRRGKAWAEFKAEHDGKEIVNRAEWELVNRMAQALVEHHNEVGPSALEVLRGVREQTISWTMLGRACSGTPDVRSGTIDGEEYVTELKTDQSTKPERFKHSVRRNLYRANLAWYLDGVRLSGLGNPRRAYIVAVESKRPHPVTVFRLTDNAIESGRRDCRAWFEQLLVCEESNHWPPYVQGVVDLDVEDEDGFALNIGGKSVRVERDDEGDAEEPEPLGEDEAEEIERLF